MLEAEPNSDTMLLGILALVSLHDGCLADGCSSAACERDPSETLPGQRYVRGPRSWDADLVQTTLLMRSRRLPVGTTAKVAKARDLCDMMRCGTTRYDTSRSDARRYGTRQGELRWHGII